MKNALKYAVLALGPIILIVGIVISMRGGGPDLPNSLLYVNVYTGESERLSLEQAGASVLKDDQGRSSRFIAVDSEGSTKVSSGEPMFIRERDRSVFDIYIADGRLDPETVKVDPETYRILN